jgi:hypothetical protein
MNIPLREKTLNIIIIVTLLSHLTFLHNVLEAYVICFGTDGHITVEEVKDCDECSNNEFLLSNNAANIELKNVDCKDIPLDQYCLEVNQFIIKNKAGISDNVLKLTSVLSESGGELKYYYSINEKSVKNHILENYTTVSLLI